MKKALLALILVPGLVGCASSSGGGGGAGGAFFDCYENYCVGYEGLGRYRLYLRTPATPVTAARGNVTRSEPQGGSTRVVTRPSTSGPRMSPLPPGSGGRQP
jgi:hypothetical protein